MENVGTRKSSTENKNELRAGEPDAELQKLINSIDLDFLHSLILEDLKHTDLYPDKLNFLNFEEILGVKELYIGNMEIAGVYRPGVANLINISGKAILETAAKSKVSKQTVLVYMVCHELAHSVVKNISGLLPTKVGTYHKYGYGKFQVDFGRKNEKTEFDIFEEGLTEKYGREIFLKFAKGRPGFLPEDETSKFIEFRDQRGGRVAQFNSAIWFANSLIKKISLETGFPEETVWHAILRDKIESSGFDDEELQDLVAEFVTDNDFLDELKKAELPEDFKKLEEKLKITKNPNFTLRARKLVEKPPISFI